MIRSKIERLRYQQKDVDHVNQIIEEYNHNGWILKSAIPVLNDYDFCITLLFEKEE